MEWSIALLLIFGSLVILIISGMPIAFGFLVLNFIWMYFFFGDTGLQLVVLSSFASVTSFSLLPIPLFMLMGEVMFQSGLIPLMLSTMDKWLGRLPGRLALLAVSGGTLFSTLTGSSTSSVAMLGSSLVPELEKRGYKKPMSLGPILGSGGLAMMIPPSGLAVFVAFIGGFSVGSFLMAIILPGLLMAFNYATYIITRCKLQPDLAPTYEVSPSPISEKLIDAAHYILPVGFIIFMVLGLIFLGIATPTEAAATGALSSFILAASFKRLNWNMLKKTLYKTFQTVGMLLIIILGARGFAEILTASGASIGLIEFSLSLPIAPILIVMITQVVVLILGMFVGVGAIIMICLPIFMPIISAFGFNPLWFGVLFLINIEIATTSPPFGMSLFVMKGVAPPGTTFGDTARAALPFIYCDLVAMALIMIFPEITLWLP
ncbi:TRAP transporter large permease subunit, partial [Chloroflexota bacterium]